MSHPKNSLLAAVSLLALGATAARANGPVTGTLSMSATSAGNPVTEIQSFDSLVVVANYSVTNLGNASAHVEMDFCAPAWIIEGISTSTGAELPSCHLADGEQGIRESTPEITAGSSSQGTTGIFSVLTESTPGVTLDGTVWTIPGRLVLDDGSNTVLASASVTVTVRAHTNPTLAKSLVGVAIANKPGGGESGYNVTWAVQPNDSYSGVDGLEYESGTNVIHDPVPAGAIYVGAAYTPFQSLYSNNVNINPSITAPGAAPSQVTDVVMSVDNLLGDALEMPTWTITYWYPGSTTLATNTANATFADGKTASATASVYLGAGIGQVGKEHLCPNSIQPVGTWPFFSAATAFEPDSSANLECAWGPETPVQFELELSALEPSGAPNPGAEMPLLDPVATDVLPPNLSLVSFDGVYALTDIYYQTDLSAGWQVSGSTDSGCGASSGTFTPLVAGAPPSAYANIRCLRYSYSGFTVGVAAHFSAVLDQTDREALDAALGSYEVVTNHVFLGADNIEGTIGASLDTTFWNSSSPGIYMGYTNGAVGDVVSVIGDTPENNGTLVALVNAYLGFTDLTWGGTLPLALDTAGVPSVIGGQLVDDSGSPVNPICTATPQDRSGATVTPATWQCRVPGHIPSFTSDPYANPNCVAPFFCFDSSSNIPWNAIEFSLPMRIVAGSQGEGIPFTTAIWDDGGPIASDGVAPPGSSAANPVTFTNYVYVNGTPQLTVQKSTPNISVEGGGSIGYFIDYSNTGTVTTTNTYVYDLFGMNPTTGDLLSQDFAAQGCNASDAPTLLSVTHVSGAPASTVEYTTTPNPTPATASWSTTAPSPLSSVTGLRFQLASAFTGNPGDYAPGDQAGREQITLQAPQDQGQKLCNMAAIGADGFTIAGALAVGGAVPITPHCEKPGGCDPVSVPGPDVNTTVGPACGSVTVTLDGSQSVNADSYAWSENGDVFATTAIATTPLAAGVHTITLTVTNSFGVSVSKSITATIADTEPPVVSCPSSVQATINSSCQPAYTVDATATDNCDAAPVVTCNTPGFNAGQTEVTATCTATDSAGNTSDACSVTVTLGNGVSAPSLTFGAPSGAPAPDGNLCNSRPIDLPFEVSRGCGPFYPYQLGYDIEWTDGSGGQHQLQSYQATYNDYYDPTTDATGTLHIDLTGLEIGSLSIRVIDTAENYAEVAEAVAQVTTEVCSCGPAALSASSNLVEGTQDGSGSGYCGTTQVAVPVTVTAPCDALNSDYQPVVVDYYDAQGNLIYEDDSESINWDNDDYIYYPSTDATTGLVWLNLPAANGPITVTIHQVDPNAWDPSTAAVIATTTVTVPVVNDCDNTVCVPDAMVMFEDRWPDNGDLDFNDETFATNYQFLTQGNEDMPDGQQIDEMVATFNILSLGATLHNGVYLHLPIPAGSDVTMSLIDSNGNSWPAPQPVAGESELVIPLVQDSRTLFQNASGFINTDPALPAIQGTGLALTVVFNDPGTEWFDTSVPAFDLFIARSDDYSHQVHLTEYPGTPLADGTLFDHSADGSTLAGGPYYVNTSGLPFGLAVPYVIYWPQETVDISSVYGNIVNFAQGDMNYSDWWDYSFDSDLAYTQGANNTYPPYPNDFAPALSGIYGPCYDNGGGGGGDDRAVRHGRRK